MNGICEDFGDLDNAQILLIAHDPGAIDSEEEKYSLYADYCFKEDDGSDKDFKIKKDFSSSILSLIKDLTDNKFKDEDIFITSFCNTNMEHNGDKPVYIPGSTAQQSIDRIYNILDNSLIQYVFSASTQVNYLLQKLGVYNSENNFIQAAQPVENGQYAVPPYYESINKNALSMIDGKVYNIKNSDAKIIPIVDPVLIYKSKHPEMAMAKKGSEHHGKKKKPAGVKHTTNIELIDYEKDFERIRNYFKNVEV